MTRDLLIARLRERQQFDLLVIGGGATGCGIALDAASRGLNVALVERGDFAEGTSSRSTKLVHGGVRYLEAALLHLDRVQFNLVRDGLHERGVLLRIAPHLVNRITLVTPLYQWHEIPYVYSGLCLYDLLAGGMGLGRSRLIGRSEALQRFPMIRKEGLKAGVLYNDGQFNDARMNLALALTAIEHGAVVVNHLAVTSLVKVADKIVGAVVRDRFSGESWEVLARGVINATGPFTDRVRLMDDPGVTPLLKVSSGVHIVLDRRFTPPDAGITIPRTEDGRVLFILPWQGYCLVGTTDEAAEPVEHPRVSEQDIDYLLRHLHRYFNLQVERTDIRAAWAGLRPLVIDPSAHDTARLARDHQLSVSPAGLISIVGGKWTTYRKMALDTVDYAVRTLGLTTARQCCTDRLVLVGGSDFQADGESALVARYGLDPEVAHHLHFSYGNRGEDVARLSTGESGERLVEGHPYLKGEVLYAVREELALRAIDVVSHRLPLAFLDNGAARRAAATVVALMAEELGWDAAQIDREMDELRERLDGVL
jgi:glycerol-3-phosphate dehydrogenase